MWRSDDNLMYSNPIYIPIAYYFTLWISEIRSQQATKKESERKRAESKQAIYILEKSKLQNLNSDET